MTALLVMLLLRAIQAAAASAALLCAGVSVVESLIDQRRVEQNSRNGWRRLVVRHVVADETLRAAIALVLFLDALVMAWWELARAGAGLEILVRPAPFFSVVAALLLLRMTWAVRRFRRIIVSRDE